MSRGELSAARLSVWLNEIRYALGNRSRYGPREIDNTSAPRRVPSARGRQHSGASSRENLSKWVSPSFSRWRCPSYALRPWLSTSMLFRERRCRMPSPSCILYTWERGIGAETSEISTGTAVRPSPRDFVREPCRRPVKI